MKHRITLLCSFILFAALGVMGQEPSMTFDGTKLRVMVPMGYLELKQAEVADASVRDCFTWNDGSCIFMARPDAYVFEPKGLSTNATVNIEGLFNGDAITIPLQMVPAPSSPSQNKEAVSSPKVGTNLPILIAAAVLVLASLLVFLLRKKKGEKGKHDPNTTNDPNIISVITDSSVTYNHGLGHVKERMGEYLTFDMDMVFADTTINKVYINTALVKKLYDFFNGSLEADGRTNETGCFIIGCWDFEEGRNDRYDISLEEMVEPGDDADFGEYSLNFGKKISINMASVIDNLAQKTKRDYVLTCWMHSHPGLGLFLSNQDLIVQQQLTYSDHRNRLIAIVIDTNTPDFKVGFFTSKADGKMNNKEEVKRWFSFEEIYRQSREMSRNQPAQTQKEDTPDTRHDCFNIALNDNAIGHVGFAPRAINQIDHALYSGVKGVVGYFYGEAGNHYLQVGCCLPYENEEKLGCLVFHDGLTESQLANYAKDIEGCRFFINSSSDDKLAVWTRNEQGGYAHAGETTLAQMKEWIRRKRV